MIASFEDRILPLDARAAQSSGRVQGERKRVGRPVDLSDCLIAGITLASGATLVTRNTRHFSDLPIKIIDPWTAPL